MQASQLTKMTPLCKVSQDEWAKFQQAIEKVLRGCGRIPKMFDPSHTVLKEIPPKTEKMCKNV